MSDANDVAETDSEKRPMIYARLGELEFDVTGAEGESIEDVGEVFDERIDSLVDYADELQDGGPTNGTH
jgi:hypothetical protein